MAQNTYNNEEYVSRTRARLGISNTLHIILNFLAMLSSIPCIGFGIWLATRHGSECLRNLQWPIIAVGVFIFVFSLLGIIGAFLRIKILLWLYLLLALLVILTLLGIATFAFIATSRGSGQALEGKAYEDYNLDDYSTWMQHELRRVSHWTKIRKCVLDNAVCRELNYTDSKSFFDAHLTPLQSGCCKPPSTCNFEFVNATNWIPSKNTTSSGPADCSSWNNDPTKLCYDCDSCRAAVAENSRRAWSKLALACAVLMVFLILVYTLGCCAARNDRNRYYERRKVVTNSSKTGYNESRNVQVATRV